MSDTPTSSDTTLLSRWRSGDRRAGAQLLARHHPSVARFFLHKLGPDCDDLVQATFLGLLEGIDRFRGEASFRTLLFAIARNKLLKHLRERSRDQRRFDPSRASIAGLEPSPVSLMAVQEQHKLLLTALRRLPIDTQLMLELHYWEKLPIKEIALVLDMPINTVKTRMRRGRLRLDAEMEALAASPEQLESTRRGLDGWAERLREELDR